MCTKGHGGFVSFSKKPFVAKDRTSNNEKEVTHEKKKLRKGLAAVVAGVTLMTTGIAAMAASTITGAVGGASCRGTVTCKYNRASAETFCVSGDNQDIYAEVTGYTLAPDGNYHACSESIMGDTYVVATVTSEIYQIKEAKGYHRVVYGSTWSGNTQIYCTN